MLGFLSPILLSTFALVCWPQMKIRHYMLKIFIKDLEHLLTFVKLQYNI